MRTRFLADADLNKAIVNGLLRREPSIDFLSAEAAGLRALKDSEVLALAAQTGRVLVSHDVNTMPSHFRAFVGAGNETAGLMLIPQSLAVGAAIHELFVIWSASEAAEWTGRISWIPL